MSKEEETNTPIEQLTAVIAAYIESTTEIDQRRAKEAKELDERRAKAAEARDKAAEARDKAAEAREKAAEAREKAAEARDKAAEAREKAADKRAVEAEKRAVEAEKRAVEAEKRAVEAEKRAVEAEKRDKAAEARDKAAEKRSKAAAEDTNKLKKSIEELTAQVKGTDKKHGSTANNIGRVTEEKFFSALKSQKCVGNTTFKSIEHNITCKDGKPNGRSAELDIIMHNGTYSLIIEVKYLCHLNDVEKFEEKMRTAYAYISKKFNNRKLLFGMAANKFNKDAVDYAHEHGMITFHPDGQKVRTDIPAHTLLHPDTSV